jgi:hypothetical protein
MHQILIDSIALLIQISDLLHDFVDHWPPLWTIIAKLFMTSTEDNLFQNKPSWIIERSSIDL